MVTTSKAHASTMMRIASATFWLAFCALASMALAADANDLPRSAAGNADGFSYRPGRFCAGAGRARGAWLHEKRSAETAARWLRARGRAAAADRARAACYAARRPSRDYQNR